jgi:hypothetical protein
MQTAVFGPQKTAFCIQTAQGEVRRSVGARLTREIEFCRDSELRAVSLPGAGVC